MKRLFIILFLLHFAVVFSISNLHAGGNPSCVGITCGSSRTYWTDEQRSAVEGGGLGSFWSAMGEREREMFPNFYRGGEWLGRITFGPTMQRNFWEPLNQTPPDFAPGPLDNIAAVGAISFGKFGRILGKFGSSAEILPTQLDELLPLKTQLWHDLPHVPTRAVSDVKVLQGDVRLGSGCLGTVCPLAGDPSKVVKVFHRPMTAANDVRGQVLGLEAWQRRIDAAGISNEMKVVKTLEYGVDAQGHAYTIHPRVTGGQLVNQYSPSDVQRRLSDLREKAWMADPDFLRELQQYPLDQQETLKRMSIRVGVANNYFLMPDGTFLMIDPF